MATDRSPRSPGSSTDEPSRAEIQQRVSSLYDRAESDTGTYNVTRAMSTGTRRTAGGRGSADASLDAVTRQWFDMARNRLGPITPAVLPADRRPAAPSARAARPADAPERPSDSAVVRELEAATRRVPELTSRAVAALPAAPAPEPRRDEPRALLPAVPAPASAPADRQTSLKNTKEQIGRKLTTARDVLARALAQPVPSQPMLSQPAASLPAATPGPTSAVPAAVETRSAGTPSAPSQPVQQPWDTAEQQAFRAEITAAWAGRPAAAAPGTPTANSADGLLTTGGLGFATPSSGFATPEVPLPTPASDYPTTEPGAGAAPFAFPMPDLAPTAPQAAPATPATGFQTPEPGIITTPPFAYPMPDLVPTAPQAGLASVNLGHQAYQTSELDAPASPSGYPASELLVGGAESGFTAANSLLTAPLPGYETSGLGVMLPPADVLPPADMLPPVDVPATGVGLAAPVAEPIAPAAVPADVTVSTTGTAYLGKADKALAFARAQVGRPCVWGATGPESYDCSSLTQAAWKAAGVTLPRAAIDQAKAFTRISLADLRPGDLVFFFDDLSHTGLCTGNGMMIHAPGPGAYIREEAILPFGEGALRGAVRPA